MLGPRDLYFPTLGKPRRILLIDVVVTDPRNTSNVVLTATKAGATRDKKELMKEKKLATTLDIHSSALPLKYSEA